MNPLNNSQQNSKKPRIAFQGRRGAYSQSAVYHLFGKSAEAVPVATFNELYTNVESGVCDGAVVPIENSTAGSIYENFDLLHKYKLPIVAEIKLQVEHCLMGLPGASIEKLNEVFSHPQALAQCSQFFKNNPHIKETPSFDTAGSAESIAQGNDLGKGAIASSTAAAHYGLNILQHPLENMPGSNFTRFLAIQKDANTSLNADKTLIVFYPSEEHSGVLYRALGAFARRDINLTGIESRPRIGSPWKYQFYLDFEGRTDDPKVLEAIEEIKVLSDEVQILGCFPTGQYVKLEYHDE